MGLRHLVGLIVIGALITGCGDDDSGSADTTSAPEASAATATVPEGTIEVNLVDIDAQTMAMTLSSDSAPAGTVTFVVHNTGDTEHEFVVIATDLAVADLPFDEAADEVIEGDLTVVDEIEDIKPGATETLEVDLDPGHYALICNITKHYRLGMRADFTAT